MRHRTRAILLDLPSRPAPPGEDFYKRTVKDIYGGDIVTERSRQGDRLVIKETRRTVTEDEYGEIETDSVKIKKRPCFIPWSALNDEFQLEPDNDMGAPWDEHDGWEHEKTDVDGLVNDYQGEDWENFRAELKQARGYVQQSHFAADTPFIVVVDDSSFCGDSRRSRREYFSKRGASKQVAAEMVAQQDRGYIDTIVKWMENGFEWWWVNCDITIDGHSYSASCGGIDDEDYANTDMRDEILSEVVYEMEEDGYVVCDRPKDSEPDRQVRYRASRWHSMKMRSQEQYWRN